MGVRANLPLNSTWVVVKSVDPGQVLDVTMRVGNDVCRTVVVELAGLVRTVSFLTVEALFFLGDLTT
jgi:hypothetical protein